MRTFSILVALVGLTLVAVHADGKAPRNFRTLKGHSDDVLMISIEPKGKLMASASAESVRLWKLPSGRRVAELKAGETDSFGAVALGPLGKHLAVAVGSKIRLMAIKGRKLAQRYEFDHNKDVSRLLFNSDEAILVSAAGDGVRVWRVNTGELLGKAAADKDVLAVGVSPATGDIAVAFGKEIHLYSRSGKEKGKIAGVVSNGARAFAYSPDGNRLLVIGSDRKIHLLNAADGKALWSQGRVAYDTAVAFSPDGKLALTNFSDGKLKGLGVAGGSDAWFVKGSAAVAVIGAGGKIMATPGANSTVLLWKLR